MSEPFVFPPFHPVRMRHSGNTVRDMDAVLARELAKAVPSAGIRPGDRVAVAVGSRGITGIATMVRHLCQALAAAGARPVVVPAMGSHGGATAEGQTAVLASLGITAGTVNAPIAAGMATVDLGTVFDRVPVRFSEEAFHCRHTILINRVKPHTKFKADVESGLAKMLCVGLGKHQGAEAFHRWAVHFGFERVLKAMAGRILDAANVRFGIAIVEDAADQPIVIEAVPADRFASREPELLVLAKTHFPRLPVADLDILIIERIGKDISGAGMDPNVTGRAYDLMESDFSGCLNATRIAVLDLSPATGGNALGLGNADIITEAVFRKMDYEKTVINALTSLSLHKAFIPVRLPDDRSAIRACFTTIGPKTPEKVRAAIIGDTRHLDPFWASTALAHSLRGRPDLAVGEAVDLSFAAAGKLAMPQISEEIEFKESFWTTP